MDVVCCSICPAGILWPLACAHGRGATLWWTQDPRWQSKITTPPLPSPPVSSPHLTAPAVPPPYATPPVSLLRHSLSPYLHCTTCLTASPFSLSIPALHHLSHCFTFLSPYLTATPVSPYYPAPPVSLLQLSESSLLHLSHSFTCLSPYFTALSISPHCTAFTCLTAPPVSSHLTVPPVSSYNTFPPAWLLPLSLPPSLCHLSILTSFHLLLYLYQKSSNLKAMATGCLEVLGKCLWTLAIYLFRYHQ